MSLEVCPWFVRHFHNSARPIRTDRTLHPLEFAEKKEKVLAQLEEFQTQTQNIIEVIENPEVIAALRQDKLQNLHFLKENYNVR